MRLQGGNDCDSNDDVETIEINNEDLPGNKEIPTTIYLHSDKPRVETVTNECDGINNNNDSEKEETRMIGEFYDNSDNTPEPEEDHEQSQEEPDEEDEDDGNDDNSEPEQPHDPLEDEVPPTNPPPSYTPLLSKNDDWGDTLLPRVMYDNDDFIRI